jgi:hypothetical protein
MYAKRLSEKIITTLTTIRTPAISLTKCVSTLPAQVHEDQCRDFYKNRHAASVIRSHLYLGYGRFECRPGQRLSF